MHCPMVHNAETLWTNYSDLVPKHQAQNIDFMLKHHAQSIEASCWNIMFKIQTLRSKCSCICSKAEVLKLVPETFIHVTIQNLLSYGKFRITAWQQTISDQLCCTSDHFTEYAMMSGQILLEIHCFSIMSEHLSWLIWALYAGTTETCCLH